jgi:hypothetical protein
MISIGGVALDDDLIWSDRYTSTHVEQHNKRTLGGRLVTYTGELLAGVPITLNAVSDQGWLTKAQVVALLAIANVPGATYALVFGAENYTVMFDNSNGPAVNMQPIVPRSNDDDADWFTGTIKLITV